MDYTYFWQNMHFPLDSIQSVLLKPAIAVSRISNMQTITLGFSTVFATIYIYIYVSNSAPARRPRNYGCFWLDHASHWQGSNQPWEVQGEAAGQERSRTGFSCFSLWNLSMGRSRSIDFVRVCVCVLTPSSILKFFFANCFTIHIYILIQFMFDRLRIIAWTLMNCSVEWSKHNTGKCR